MHRSLRRFSAFSALGAWEFITRSLAEYMQGELNRCLLTCDQARAIFGPWSREPDPEIARELGAASVEAIASLAQIRQGKVEAARPPLAEARKVKARWREQVQSAEGLPIFWQDYTYLELLVEQAERLMC